MKDSKIVVVKIWPHQDGDTCPNY